MKPDPAQSGGFSPSSSYDSYLSAASTPSKAPKGMQRSGMRTTGRDPWFEAAGQFALGRAIGLADRPYEGYTGQRVAGLSGNEQAASGVARGFSDRIEPYAARLRGGFSGENISAFMNPYTDKVLNARLRGINDEFGRQSASLSRNAAATDAFRSGRTDLARARLDASRMRALDEATGETNAAAFESAKDSMFRQGAQDLGAIGAIGQVTDAERRGLMETGATERSIDQANRDFQYGQFLERRDWDINNLNNLIAAIQGVDSTAGKTEETYGKKPKKSTFGTILGLAGTAVGAMFGQPDLGGAIGGAVGGAIDG